jgi:HD-like signal output (HDOD) protein
MMGQQESTEMSGQGTQLIVDTLLDRADQLHSPPEVAQSLLNLTRNDDFGVREIVECIQRDPAMSAKMLQVVNSARYGLRNPVTNLNQAVALLGQRTVRLLAMTFSIVDSFAAGPAKSMCDEYWRDALTMACAASRIGDDGTLDRNDVYTAGLLANLGSLIMAQAEGEDYLTLYRAHPGAQLCEAERQAYGFGHATVGARLLEKWKFPQDTLEAIRRHHDNSANEPIELAIRGGALLAEAIWQKDPAVVNSCRAWLEVHFGIDIDGFTDLAIECRDEVLLEFEVFGVNIDQSFDCRELLEQARRQYLDSSLNTAMDLDSLESVMTEM